MASKNGAIWWKYFDIYVDKDPVTKEPIACGAQCTLCDKKFTHTNVDRNEEKELQLMCTAVDEEEFGNALVDSVLL